jgi:hypothetical protein
MGHRWASAQTHVRLVVGAANKVKVSSCDQPTQTLSPPHGVVFLGCLNLLQTLLHLSTYRR